MLCGQRAKFSWLRWTGYGKWLVYQLGTTRGHTTSQRGGSPQAYSFLGAPRVLTRSRELRAFFFIAQGGASRWTLPISSGLSGSGLTFAVSPCFQVMASHVSFFDPHGNPLNYPLLCPLFPGEENWGSDSQGPVGLSVWAQTSGSIAHTLVSGPAQPRVCWRLKAETGLQCPKQIHLATK